MAHYPTLAYSQFGVRADALPAHLRPPPELDVRGWSHHMHALSCLVLAGRSVRVDGGGVEHGTEGMGGCWPVVCLKGVAPGAVVGPACEQRERHPF